jgi:hypothetical protein
VQPQACSLAAKITPLLAGCVQVAEAQEELDRAVNPVMRERLQAKLAEAQVKLCASPHVLQLHTPSPTFTPLCH